MKDGELRRVWWHFDFLENLDRVEGFERKMPPISSAGFTLESYIQRMNQTQQAKQKRTIARAKETGQEYFTPDRLRKMNASQRLVTD